MPRETKKILLPVSKKEAEIKAFFNTNEKEALFICLGSDEQNEAKKIIAYQNELVVQGVILLDGSSDNIIDRIKTEYRAKDYKALIDTLVEVNKEDDEKKDE